METTFAARTLADINRDLTNVVSKIIELSEELGRAPAWKRSTPWWNDRVGARSQLLRQRDALYAERRERCRSK